MIKLITGHKGSGKTKKLITAVHDAVEQSKGNVVCVEKGPTLTYDITHRARLIDVDSYAIAGFDAFYGFLSGLCAGNYDLTDVFVDATLRICGRDYEQLADFFAKIAKLSEAMHTEFVFTVSCDDEELPARVFEVAQKY